jgi:hypothetical protein
MGTDRLLSVDDRCRPMPKVGCVPTAVHVAVKTPGLLGAWRAVPGQLEDPVVAVAGMAVSDDAGLVGAWGPPLPPPEFLGPALPQTV